MLILFNKKKGKGQAVYFKVIEHWDRKVTEKFPAKAGMYRNSVWENSQIHKIWSLIKINEPKWDTKALEKKLFLTKWKEGQFNIINQIYWALSMNKIGCPWLSIFWNKLWVAKNIVLLCVELDSRVIQQNGK